MKRPAPPPPRSSRRARPTLIVPSILAADFGHLADQVAAAEEAGADRFQVDIMDGHFVPNLSMGPMFVATLRRLTRLPIEAHLMTARPHDWIRAVADAGADWIIAHAEATSFLDRIVTSIVAAGARPAVALNPATPLCLLDEILPRVGMVLQMTVHPGWGGQRFLDHVLDKLRRLRAMIDSRGVTCDIEIDGGVESDTIGAAALAGANIFVAGSAVFSHPEGPAAGIAGLRAALNGQRRARNRG